MLYENMAKGWQLADVWCIFYLSVTRTTNHKGAPMNMNTTPTDAKGWIPTEIGNLKHPCIRGAECDAAATGVVRPYLPWFSSKGAANAWCRKIDAVATACEYGKALDIAKRNGAELMEA